ncbi:MAG: ABC transporter permease [Deferribacterota bacterium]|nr:ABC transporter permease [Deferribacterota bacterium]
MYIITFPFSVLGRASITFVHELGAMFLFSLNGVYNIFIYPFQIKKILQQVYFVGVKSFLVIVLIGLFTGMVMALQGYAVLSKVGTEGLLGAGVALALIKELGPVLGSIMIVGRAGSSMAAEIGIMRITEQIDALFTMDINPIKYIFSPRIVASLIAFPLLIALFDVVGILGGYLTGVILLGVDPGAFVSKMLTWVTMDDVMESFYKAFLFGMLVVVICCYQGFFVHKRKEVFGARGVSFATTSAVVISCVVILAADYVITSFLM